MPNELENEGGQAQQGKYYNIIVAAEANWSQAQETYEKDRKYIENVQEPSTKIPEGEQYIKEDKITDLHRRLVGGMIAGEIDIRLEGGGDKKKPLKELFHKIFKANMFKENIVENNMNFFYGEGLGWVRYDYNPFKKSIFGIGSPVIEAWRPGEGMFDPESIDLMHYKDNIVLLKVRKKLKYVKTRWPEKADEVVETQEEYGGVSAEAINENQYVDLYEIGKMDTVLEDALDETGNPIKDDEGNILKLETDKYSRAFVANKTVDLEEQDLPDDTDFRMIPIIHTPRVDTDNKYGRYPFGVVRLLAGSQDVLNIITSMMVRVVKKDIKNLAIISGANADEVTNYYTEASKEHGVVTLNTPEARINFAPKTGLAPSMVQLRNIIAFTFDSQTGKFSPDRGENQGNLSGVAIGKLQNRGTLPEFVAKNHIEVAYTRLARQVLNSIKNEMNAPFSITTTVDGEEQKIWFNTELSKLIDVDYDTDYNISTQDGEQGIINDLNDLDEIDVTIRVEMNLEERKNFEMQKAFALANAGKLATEDLLKQAYPDTYQERLQNLRKEQKAFEIMERISNLDPNMLQEVDNLTGEMEQMVAGLTSLAGQGQGAPSGNGTGKSIAQGT